MSETPETIFDAMHSAFTGSMSAMEGVEMRGEIETLKKAIREQNNLIAELRVRIRRLEFDG